MSESNARSDGGQSSSVNTNRSRIGASASSAPVSVPVPRRSAEAMKVMASYTDRELIEALMERAEIDDGDDFDLEGHDYTEQITVDRLTLREALRRVAAWASEERAR